MSGPSTEQVQAMYAYYQQGYSLVEVGDCFHYTDMAVLYIFRKHNLPRRQGRTGFMMKFEAETRRMHADHIAGLSITAIARKYGYRRATIIRRFNRFHLSRRRGELENGWSESKTS